MAATPSMLQLSRRRAITGTRERRDWQERGATAGVRRVYPGRAPPQHSGEAAARRGQDDPGGPAQAQRGGGNVGCEPEDPPIANAAYFWPSEGRGRGRPRKHLDTDDNYT